jgi:NitT/TauT family transport system substrate-binding protein
MWNIRALRFLAMGLVTLFAIIGCAQQANNSSSPSSSPSAAPLAVGLNPWVGYAVHHVAMGKGLYKEAGLNVQETMFQTNSDQVTAFLAGKLDASWTTSSEVIQMQARDPSVRIIYLTDYSDGSDGIIGRNINAPADAKGKTIGREDVLFEKVLLRAYLNKGGLTEKDVTLKDIPAPDAASAFAAKRLDIAVTFEPFMSKAAKQGGGKVIFSTKGTNLIADVIAVRQSVLDKRKPELISLLKAADKASKLVQANDPDALKLTAAKLSLKPEELKEQLAGVKLFDLASNKSIGFNQSNPNNLFKNLELTSKVAYDLKVTPTLIEPKNTYDDSLLKSL